MPTRHRLGWAFGYGRAQREAALQAGVDDFLAKPLDLQTMNATLSLYLRQGR